MDSYECWRNLLNDVLRGNGKEPLSREVFDASWGQGPEADQQMFFPDWTLEQVLRFYNRRFPDYTKWARTRPDVQTTLKKLKTGSKKLAVASNSPTPIVRNLLSVTGLESYLDLLIGVDQVKHAKPSPDLLLFALQKLGLDLQDACYVGDSAFDEEAARAAGILFIGYKRQGDLTIHSLEELVTQSL